MRGYRESSLSRRTFRSIQGYLSVLFMQFLSNIKLQLGFSSLHAEAMSFLTKICTNELKAYLIELYFVPRAPRGKIVTESNMEVDVNT